MEIANNEFLRTKAYIFGVVLDCTEPFKSKDKDNYASKLKIIDPSFNFKEQSSNSEVRFNRFATVYIYSSEDKYFPKPKKVGDIIRLRRFNFVVSENGELIGHQQKYSNWLVYDGEDFSNKIISCQNIQKNTDRVLKSDELELINKTRTWAIDFLSKYSLIQLTWWRMLKEPLFPALTVKNKDKASEVDLILKTENVNQELKKITFRDFRGNIYFLILHAPAVLKEGNVIKLKCVDVFFTKDGRYLRLTPCTSCLSVPSSSFDAKLFENTSPETIINNLNINSPFNFIEDENNYYNTRKKVITKFPFLQDYNFEDFLINEKYLSLDEKNIELISDQPTLIHKNYENRMPVDLLFLHNLLSDPKNNEFQEFLHQKFVIKAQIKEIINGIAPKFIKKHCSKCGVSEQLNTKKFECCEQMMQIYFHLIFIVADKVNKENLQFPIYVVCGENSNLFDLWELIPHPSNYQGFLEWDEISLFNKKLKNFEQSKKEMEFLVELKQTQNGHPFLELNNTLLMP